jgi:hypothetical protein
MALVTDATSETMKLPFTFGTKLIFRLVFPGLILTAIFAPLIHTLLAWAFAGSGLEVPDLAALSLEVVLWGWLVVLADQPIYMLYEGRRWWPRVLLQSGRRREERRLAKLRRNADASMRLVDADLYRESGVELLKFPIGDDWEPRAMYPTRLGNLLTAYETHASRMYKLDAIFYWPRLWIALDKDLREEVDNHQAVADSGVYVSFALWLACVMALFYAAYNALLIRALQHPQLKLDYTPPASVLLALSAISALLAYGVYRLSSRRCSRKNNMASSSRHSSTNFAPSSALLTLP